MPGLSDGAGRVALGRIGARTVPVRAWARSPLVLRLPRNHGAAAWVYVGNLGGGLVRGDALDLAVEVGPDACAAVMTQASTKVYPSPTPTRQRLRATIAAGATLMLLPDHVAPFAGARFEQDQAIELAPGASLILVDAFTSGRYEAGERWRFERYRSRIEIARAGRPILREAIELDPADGELARRHGRWNVIGLAVLLGPAVAAHGEQVRARATSGPDVHVSATRLPREPGGTLVRWAATGVEAANHRVRALLDFVPALLGDDPFLRRA